MSEPVEPELVDGDQPAGGEVEFGWFDGILQGHVGSAPEGMRAAVRRLAAARLAEPDLRIEGGRFSVLLGEGTIPGHRFSDQNSEEFRGALEDLVAALPEGAAVESTLRCTMVSGAEATETLFTVVAGQVRPLSRRRPATGADQARRPDRGQVPALQNLGTGRLVAILALLLVAFASVAWQAGYIDRVFSPSASQLTVNEGVFRNLLAVEIESEFFEYVVRVRRGSDFPAKANDVERLLAEREETSEQAAVRLVADGDRLWVQLRDGGGKVLESKSAALRPLLEDASEVVEIALEGKIGTKELRLSLSSGRPKESKKK